MSTAARAVAPGSQVSASLIVRLDRSGSAQILDVVEEPGLSPVVPSLVGEYVFEVYEGRTVLALDSAVDPFALRSVAPSGSGPEHLELSAPSATVRVHLSGVAVAGRSLGLRVHHLTRRADSDRLDAATFAGLRTSGALALSAEIDPAALAPSLSRARRLPVNVRPLE